MSWPRAQELRLFFFYGKLRQFRFALSSWFVTHAAARGLRSRVIKPRSPIDELRGATSVISARRGASLQHRAFSFLCFFLLLLLFSLLFAFYLRRPHSTAWLIRCAFAHTAPPSTSRRFILRIIDTKVNVSIVINLQSGLSVCLTPAGSRFSRVSDNDKHKSITWRYLETGVTK